MKSGFNIHEIAENVDLDDQDSEIRNAATLLVQAMTDWPTRDQSDVSAFVREFETDFGSGLTSDQLKMRSTPEPWKVEAKASIEQMLELFPENDLSAIVDAIGVRYAKT